MWVLRMSNPCKIIIRIIIYTPVHKGIWRLLGFPAHKDSWRLLDFPAHTGLTSVTRTSEIYSSSQSIYGLLLSTKTSGGYSTSQSTQGSLLSTATSGGNSFFQPPLHFITRNKRLLLSNKTYGDCTPLQHNL